MVKEREFILVWVDEALLHEVVDLQNSWPSFKALFVIPSLPELVAVFLQNIFQENLVEVTLSGLRDRNLWVYDND